MMSQLCELYSIPHCLRRLEERLFPVFKDLIENPPDREEEQGDGAVL